jgi:dipeptidyl aminopeptidase/acylaminoacyl peptidase
MATPFTIDRYLNIRAAYDPSFSPDGRFIAFLTNTTGVFQLWQVPMEGGWPTQLTFSRDSVRSCAYSPRVHQIVFSQDRGGNERTQLYRLHGVGGGTNHGIGEGWVIENLTRHPKAIHNLGGWSHEGDRIAFSANRADPSRFDIYVQRIGDHTARRLAKGPGGYFQPAGWSPNDRTLLASHVPSSFNQDIYLVDVATGKLRLLTPHQHEAQYHSPRWSADGKAVYCSSTAGGRDMSALARIDVASGKLTYLDQPDHEVGAVFASRGGRWLAWLVNVAGKSELRVRDLRSNRTRPLPLPSLGLVSGIDFAPDESKLAFVFNGPRYNPDIWVWDFEAARPRQLTHADRAGIPLSEFAEPELIHYPTFDGRKIPAWFYRPRNSDGRLPPVIVHPHGGPESQTRPGFNALLQYFIDHGYAVLAPNVRGSSGYGTAYMNLDNTTRRMDSVKDLAHAAYWLRDQKKGDPKRLAVYGGSYGGFMVLAAVTHYPDLWAAGIDVVGIANFVTFLERTGPYRRAHREAEYGNLREHREFFEKISPIHHVDKIRCPMMVIHGANDPRVPIGEAEQIVAALRARRIPVEYLRYADEGHGLAKLKNRLDAFPKMAAFLDKYLK